MIGPDDLRLLKAAQDGIKLVRSPYQALADDLYMS